MHIGGKSVLPFGQFLNGDVHIGGNFIVMRRPVQLAGEFFLTRREAFAHLNCCAAQIRTFAQMVNHGAANAQAGIAGKGHAFLFGIFLRCGNQADITNLQQIINFNRRVDATVKMPGNALDEIHMCADQRFRLKLRVCVVGSHEVVSCTLRAPR